MGRAQQSPIAAWDRQIAAISGPIQGLKRPSRINVRHQANSHATPARAQNSAMAPRVSQSVVVYVAKASSSPAAASMARSGRPSSTRVARKTPRQAVAITSTTARQMAVFGAPVSSHSAVDRTLKTLW